MIKIKRIFFLVDFYKRHLKRHRQSLIENYQNNHKISSDFKNSVGWKNASIAMHSHSMIVFMLKCLLFPLRHFSVPLKSILKNNVSPFVRVVLLLFLLHLSFERVMLIHRIYLLFKLFNCHSLLLESLKCLYRV